MANPQNLTAIYLSRPTVLKYNRMINKIVKSETYNKGKYLQSVMDDFLRPCDRKY
jgi:hypothetical protein